MVLRKTKPHISVTNTIQSDGNRVQPLHHWAFLEEIEAPMWTDLTSEVKFTYQDYDDEWFHISHPFHQCSSRQLISSFSHSGEGSTNTICGIIEGPSSPKLPPSVSRSRGKDYKTMEWGKSKPHPVKNLCSKSLRVSSGSGKEVKRNLKGIKFKGHAVSKEVSVGEGSSTETSGPNYLKTTSSLWDSKPCSNSISLKDSESSLTRTITSECSDQQQQKSVEASSQIFGQTSELLSSLRVSLRKSCVTRPASRVEINGGRRSEGCKSSSGKSSVGSSSNPRYDGKSLTHRATQNKEKTPESRNVARISEAPKNRVRVTNMANPHATKVRETIASNYIKQGITKAKVRDPTVRAKALVPQRVNQQDRVAATKAKDKVEIGRHNRFVDGGKENALERMAVSQKNKTKATGDMVQVQKSSDGGVPEKSDRRKPVGSKEKMNGISKGKKSTNVPQKVYLR